MASRKSFFNAPADPKSSRSGRNANTANNSGTAKKTVKSSGTIVKSRYLQPAEKASLSKSNSLTDSVAGPLRPSSPKAVLAKPKVGTPPRHSLAPQALAESLMSCVKNPSVLGQSVLQSTFADGPCIPPDFDISVIKDRTVIENATEPERNPENEKEIVEMQTFLLAYLTAKMESNTAKFKAEAEERILQAMREEEPLRNEVKEKKQQYLLAERKKLLNETLDMQIETLTPVAEAAEQFTKDYKCFAAAVDTTCHELPVKNFYISGDGKEFLGKAEAFLKDTEKLLQECTQGDHVENSASLECLKNMKKTSKDLSQQLSGTFSELQELSSLVCRHSVLAQQVVEEEQLGVSRTRELFCPKTK